MSTKPGEDPALPASLLFVYRGALRAWVRARRSTRTLAIATMDAPVSIVERTPSAEEYSVLIAAVGFRRRDPKAAELALANSCFSVCAEVDNQIVGCGRVIGDGALHFYLTDVIVRPEFQRRGIGTRIVRALTRYVESIPYVNTVVGVLPTSGLVEFYSRHGYKAQGSDSPAMLRWLNRSDG